MANRAPQRRTNLDTSGATQPALRIENLSVDFLTTSGVSSAVQDVSLEVWPGQILAIVGESGSGKSTTAACINRLLASNGEITGGTIMFRGRDLADATEREMQAIRGAHIGMVPQDPMSNLNPIQRVGAQIMEALHIHGRFPGRLAKAEAVRLLELAGIRDSARRFHQYPHEFSGGMRQRVLIAIGLACQPELLIADEPTSALDVTVQRKILGQLTDLTTRMGTAVILITHDLALAGEYAHAAVVMQNGEVVESGPAHELRAAPRADYTKRLLSAAPSMQSMRLVGCIPERAPSALVNVARVTKDFTVRSGALARATHFRAVNEVSFDIGRGQTVAIVGESGSGKSTTAKMVLKLETLTAGSIMFDGVDVTHLEGSELFHFRRRVQPVFQDPYGSLDARFTVAESVGEPLVIHKVGDRASRARRVAELLDAVALPSTLADRLPRELSGGQRQRVAIARALALDPELVVLDEAVSALDVLVQRQILELLVQLQRERGLSYLFISHDLAVVRMISHFVHVMHEGRIVESGTPETIFVNPSEAYTRELLTSIPGVAQSTRT